MRKSLAIFGEGITEWHYIESLRIACRYPFKMRPSLPQHSDIKHILAQAKKCITEGYDEVICLIDMDRLNEFPTEKQIYLKAKGQKVYKNVTFIETDPCTEYWFLLHFLKSLSLRHYENYTAIESELRKHLQGYEKTDNYFRRIRLYEYLTTHGDLNHAIELAKKSVELYEQGDKNSYSQMYLLFEKLEDFAKQK